MENPMETLNLKVCDPTRKKRKLRLPWLSKEEVTMETVRVLGKGNYGIVSLEKVNDIGYIAKKTTLVGTEGEDDLRKELRTLRRFYAYPNIVKCFSPDLEYETMGGLKTCSIYLEYASKGSLLDVVEDKNWVLPENEAKQYTLMILRALKGLHAKGYVHRDIKPDNVVAFPRSVSGGLRELKICDFGLVKEPSDPSVEVTTSRRGTYQYMPPESVGKEGKIGAGRDIWSLGCVVIAMFGLPVAPVLVAGPTGGSYFRWTVPEDISAEAKDFIGKCMALDPRERWTAERLMNHPFITGRV